MHPAFEIETKIRAYLSRSLDLDELRRWFKAQAGILLSLPPETRPLELSTALQLALIEFDRGDFSERQVRDHLRKSLAQTIEVVVEASPVLTTSGNTTHDAFGVSSEPGLSGTTITAHRLIPTGTTS